MKYTESHHFWTVTSRVAPWFEPRQSSPNSSIAQGQPSSFPWTIRGKLWLIPGSREFTKYSGKRNLLIYPGKRRKCPVFLHWCTTSGLTVTILAAYTTIFHLQRIWIVKDSSPIARYCAVNMLCTCVTHRVLRSGSYRHYYCGIK